MLEDWIGLHCAIVDFGCAVSSEPLPHDRVVQDNVPLTDANAIGSYILGSAPPKETYTNFWDDRTIQATIDKAKGKHRILLDLDVPHTYVPSTTNGHGHLIIDVPQDWDTYMKLLLLLRDMGVLQYGYVDASGKRGETWLRAPGIKKEIGKNND